MRVYSALALLAFVVAPSLDQRDTFQLPLTAAALADVSAMVINAIDGRPSRHRSKDEACFYCSGGPAGGCVEGQHIDQSSGSGDPFFKGTMHEGCTTSEDPDQVCGEHPWCGALVEDLHTRLSAAIAQRNLSVVDSLLTSNPQLHLGVSDTRVEVVDCTGRVRRSVTLPSGWSTHLSERTRQAALQPLGSVEK